MFAGNFAPNGWMFCEGQTLPISENETLFNLIGTTYGGDGESTFALPDLQSRVPIHQGNGFILAETGGVESVTLTVQQIPAHNHAYLATGNAGTQIDPAGNLVSASPTIDFYVVDTPTSPMSPTAVGMVGGSQPHDNLQPYGCFNYIISLFGVFPTQG
jgi:microcystin-dependent protein